MSKFIYKIGTAVAAAGIFGASFAPAVLADNTIDISGNGNNSNNTVNVTDVCLAGVIQKNYTKVNTNTTVDQSTGGNEANNNTGGDVNITTGNTTSSVNVTVGGSQNTATAPDCCQCVNGSSDVTISGNGNGTKNTVNDTNVAATLVVQKNRTKVRTKTTLKQKTGKNKSNGGTGGNATINSGATDSTVDVSVDPSTNSL